MYMDFLVEYQVLRKPRKPKKKKKKQKPCNTGPLLSAINHVLRELVLKSVHGSGDFSSYMHEKK